MAVVAGTVYRGESHERLPHAIVRAKPKSGAPLLATTDDDGDFSFDNLAAGEWTLVATHEELQASKAHPVTVASDDITGIDLRPIPLMKTADKKLGSYFAIGIVAALLVLIAAFAILHELFDPDDKPISASLLTLIDQTDQRLQQNVASPETPIDDGQIENLRGSTEAVVSEHEAEIAAADRAVIANTLDEIDRAVAANEAANAAAAVGSLRQLIASIQIDNDDYFWRDPPGRYVEIFLWALAGSLVSLLSSITYYLRFNRFFREGWPLHMAQLVISPVVTFVIVTFLSISTLSLDVGGSEATIDLDNPLLLGVVSFVIAYSPWSGTRWIRGTSARILRQETQ